MTVVSAPKRYFTAQSVVHFALDLVCAEMTARQGICPKINVLWDHAISEARIKRFCNKKWTSSPLLVFLTYPVRFRPFWCKEWWSDRVSRHGPRRSTTWMVRNFVSYLVVWFPMWNALIRKSSKSSMLFFCQSARTSLNFNWHFPEKLARKW